MVVQEGGAASLSIHDVSDQAYTMKPPGSRPPSPEPVHETFPIFVNALFGDKSLRLFSAGFGFDEALTLQVTEGHSVIQMKLQIQEKVQIALGQFHLLL